MTKNDLEDLKRRMSAIDHKVDEIEKINAEFIKTQTRFKIEDDGDKDDTINARIRSAINRRKPKEAARLMQNQISKWIIRIKDGRDNQAL